MIASETIARAKELLALQGLSSHSPNLEEEAKRFLVANALQMERAAQGLARSIRTREELVDTSNLNMDDIKSVLPLHWARNDELCVMFASISSSFDTQNFHQACGGSSQQQQRVFFKWLGEAVSRRCDTTNQGLVVILDLATAPFSQLATAEFDALVKTGASFLQSIYPERLRQVYCINAPSNLQIILHPFRRVCSANTMKKLVVLDSAMQIPSDVLDQKYIPKTLGGTQQTPWTDADSVYTVVQEPPLDTHSSNPNLIQEKQNGDTMQEEVEVLLKMLEQRISVAQDSERIHLAENARLRRKLKTLETLSAVSRDPEEAQLVEQLIETLQERDAYRRAVLFARNFIEQEMQERREFTTDIERKIEEKRAQNLALVEALKEAFGADAPNLLL